MHHHTGIFCLPSYYLPCNIWKKWLSVRVNRIFVLPWLKSENPLILNAFGPLQIASRVSKAYISTRLQFFVREPGLSRGHECVLRFLKDLKQLPPKLMLLIFHCHFFSLSLCLRLISLPLSISLSISVSLSISRYVNDLMCRQRRHLCEANVRRHQSFHHNGEP